MEEDANPDVTERTRVSCDDNCGAFEDPVTPDEFKAAYEHWKFHGYLCGCSHGC